MTGPRLAAQPLEGGLGRQASRSISTPLGLLDQDAVLQRPLELEGRVATVAGLGGRPEQPPDHRGQGPGAAPPSGRPAPTSSSGGGHDLIQDAPISRIDLLVCRNTLPYLNSETQAHLLARFGFALPEGGLVAAGQGRDAAGHFDLGTRWTSSGGCSARSPGATLGERLMVLAEAGERPAGTQPPRQERIRRAP